MDDNKSMQRLHDWRSIDQPVSTSGEQGDKMKKNIIDIMYYD